MMNKIVFLLLVTFLPFVYAGNFSLQKGVGVNDTNLHELAQTSWEYAKSSTTQKKYDDGFAVAFLRVAGLTDLYSLSGSNKLYLTNFDTRDVLGNWPLTPWPYLLHPKELVDTYADAGFSGKPSSSSLYLNSSVSGVGCLNKTPLRYGKISNQPEQEFLLALLFNKQLIFFSPQYQRTVFATYYDASDAYTKKESDELKEDYGSRFMEKDAQFISRIYYGAHNIGMPGHRIYSKIYTNDFNKDGNTDILVWTKYYKSNKSTEPSGFTLLRNEFTHYSRDLTAQLKSEAGITGEYLPQETSPQTIQNWLSAKNLTWQKGFPSKSECAGEEGKLILEMHDPLLNDPGVLK